MALREHSQAVPLFVRPGDRLAGSISETPGAMPVFVELGIAENGIYVGEDPERRGYLRGPIARSYGHEMQINAVDSATLRVAQQSPDERRDPVVRVAGFSEFFVHLTPDIQADVITRAEHGL
ncbi:MAG: glycine radical domain-containing protein [Planctomycetota bacterium]